MLPRTMTIILAMLMVIPVSLTVLGEEGNRVVPNVSGMLVDSVTGNGVPGIVYFNGPEGNEMVVRSESDKNGTFGLHLSPGNYTYKVDARGYEGARGGLFVGREAVTLTISLKPVSDYPEDNVYGHVMSGKDGSPLPALVYIHTKDEGSLVELKTDRGGMFSCLLRPGLYFYKVRSEGYEVFEGRFQLEKDAPVKLRVVMMPAGTDQPVSTVLVHGRITGIEGEPVRLALVTFFPILDPMIHDEAGVVVKDPDGMPQERLPEPITVEAVGGEFEVKLRPGTYEVFVESETFEQFWSIYEIPPGERFLIEIMLLPFEGGPHIGPGISVNYMDENSDGIPESIHIEVDMENDGVLDILFDYKDANSDGNPEFITFELGDGGRELLEFLMMLLEMYRFDPYFEAPPYPDHTWGEEGFDEDNNDGFPEDLWGDEEWYEDMIRDLTDPETEKHADDVGEPAPEEGNEEVHDGDTAITTDEGVTEAGSREEGNDSTGIAAALLIVGVISLILVLILGINIQRRK